MVRPRGEAMTFELEYRKWYGNGRKLRCHICNSQDLALVGQGHVWANFLCEEDHLTTVREEVTLVPPCEAVRRKVPIVEHRVTLVYEKEVVLYLPDEPMDGPLDDWIYEYHDLFDFYDITEVRRETSPTELEYDHMLLFDKDYNLVDNFNVMTGLLKDPKPKVKKPDYKQMKVIG